MKRMTVTAVLMAAGILFLTTHATAAIQEGEWSMTITIQNEGMANQMAEAQKEMEKMSPEEKAMMEQMMGGMGMNMGGPGGGMTITKNQCLTNNNPVPQANDQENCEQTHTTVGNTINFEITCDDSHSIGQVTYKNKSMNGTINSTTTVNGQEENTTIALNGKYVGPCSQANAGMSDKELDMKQRALDLKRQELELRKEEMDLEEATAAKSKSPSPKSASSTINDVNGAVNTTNNVKNTFSGLRNLFGQ